MYHCTTYFKQVMSNATFPMPQNNMIRYYLLLKSGNFLSLLSDVWNFSLHIILWVWLKMNITFSKSCRVIIILWYLQPSSFMTPWSRKYYATPYEKICKLNAYIQKHQKSLWSTSCKLKRNILHDWTYHNFKFADVT